MGHGKRAGENDESAIRFACDLLDGIFEIGSAAHGKRNYLHTRRQDPFKVRELPLHGVCRIVNNSNADCTWRYFPEHLSPFCSEAVLPEGEPGYVASRSRWARDQAGGDRIAHLCEYDRQGAGSVLQRHHGRLIAGENSILNFTLPPYRGVSPRRRISLALLQPTPGDSTRAATRWCERIRGRF